MRIVVTLCTTCTSHRRMGRVLGWNLLEMTSREKISFRHENRPKKGRAFFQTIHTNPFALIGFATDWSALKGNAVRFGVLSRSNGKKVIVANGQRQTDASSRCAIGCRKKKTWSRACLRNEKNPVSTLSKTVDLCRVAKLCCDSHLSG